MRFLKVSIEKKWGLQVHLINIADIRHFRIDVEPDFLSISFLNQTVEGFLEDDTLDITDIFSKFENGLCSFIQLKEEHGDPEEEEKND